MCICTIYIYVSPHDHVYVYVNICTYNYIWVNCKISTHLFLQIYTVHNLYTISSNIHKRSPQTAASRVSNESASDCSVAKDVLFWTSPGPVASLRNKTGEVRRHVHIYIHNIYIYIISTYLFSIHHIRYIIDLIDPIDFT